MGGAVMDGRISLVVFLLFSSLLLLSFVPLSLSQGDQVSFNTEPSYEVDEEKPPGSPLILLQAYYLMNFQLRTDGIFTLDEAQSVSQLFSVDSTLSQDGSHTVGTLRNIVLLDRDAQGAQTVFSLTVIYSVPNSTLSAQNTLTILLKDINDNAPQFSQEVYTVGLLESAVAGTLVAQPAASDADEITTEQLVDEETEDFGELIYLVDNGRIFYSLSDGNEEGLFQIDEETGRILVAPGSTFDIDLRDSYNLTVVATDAPGLNTSAEVHISILDSNDNPPQILSPGSVNVTLSEDTSPGLVILDSINATDDDQGLNSEIEFLILSGDITDSFSIDPEIGRVTLISPLDREVVPGGVLNLIIAARDRGIPPLEDTITIVVVIEDVNDFAPTFEEELYAASVIEGTRSGFSITRLVAEDGDEGPGGEISYYIIDGGDGEYYIDPETGDVFTNTTFDREERSEYRLVIEAVDNPLNQSFQLSTSVNVTIAIDDLNDNEPIFDNTSYEMHILDNGTRGFDVITISASDRDAGINAEITYLFVDPLPNHHERFRIGGSSGSVEVFFRPHYHLQTVYNYTIRAIDGGSPALHSDVDLTIVIHDVDETPPTFEQDSYNVTLNETVTIGTIVLQVQASDPDPGPIGMVHYRIITEFDEAGEFSVDRATGEIRVASRLDFDARNFTFFQVEAFDEGFPEPFTDVTNVTVYLVGENDEAPSITFPDEFFPTVPEDEPPGYDIIYLANYTSDPDMGPGGEFNFSIFEIFDSFAEEGNASFSLDSTTGLLRGLRVFDREQQPQGIVIFIETSDFGEPPQSQVINITVMIGDKNDQTPFFPENISVVAYELLPPGVQILEEFRAIDEDVGINAELEYEIYDGDPWGEFFMDPQTGGLYAAGTLNKSNQTYYNLTVLAQDRGTPSLHTFGEIMVEVIDSNDQVPIFTEGGFYIANVSENQPEGTPFFVVTAYDMDEGTNAELQYFLNDDVSNSSAEDNQMFSLHPISGELSTAAVFDRENISSFVLHVVAIDNGTIPATQTGSATITVTIVDQNDHTPTFHNFSYSTDIIENTPNGTLVISLSASDEDADTPNNEIIFSLYGYRSDVLFVDPTSGDITVAAEIDWEAGEVIEIVAIVTDQGDSPLSSTANVTVYIEDVNDRAPVFSSLSLEIPENVDPPELVTPRVMAEDDDSMGNSSRVRYEIVTDLADGRFTLDSETGQVTFVHGVLNRERRPFYQLLIRAQDSGDPPLHTDALFNISVLDANDFPPVFTSDLFLGAVSEVATSGTTVLTLEATDRDIGVNAQLTYSLIESSSPNLFAVNSTTGDVITISESFNFEFEIHYSLVVMVTDGGVPSYNDVSRVNITIIDFNDNLPVFLEEFYSSDMEENLAPYSTVLQVASTDEDSTTNEEIRYSLAETEGSEYFDIDPITGVLHTVRYINRELTRSFSLTIVANNSLSSYPNYSTVPAYVTILDLPDTHPTFTVVTHIYLNEDIAAGEQFNITAIDGDEDIAGLIYYSNIHGNEEGLFDIDSTTGSVTLTNQLDFELAPFHEFVVMATDGTNLSNYTTVLVHVLDVNDNRPTFVSSEYTVTVDNLLDVDTTILELIATDRDSGTNADLEYEIETIGADLFALESSTQPSIYVSESLEHHIGLTESLEIIVRNPGSPSTPVGRTNVTIHIQESLSSLPRFTQLSLAASVREDQLPPHILRELSPLTINVARFYIDSGNTGDVFSINNAGTLSLSPGAVLDYESQSTYQLTIRAENIAGDKSYRILTVTVEDVNDFSPQFVSSSLLVHIPETTPVDQSFYLITAVDNDGSSPANEIQINFHTSVPDDIIQDTFSIDSLSGELSLTRQLDYESGDTNFTFEIMASNEGATPPRSSITTVSVVVVNGNNHAPEFTSVILEPVVLYENQSLGLSIFNASAVDEDEGSAGEITYSLRGNHRYFDFAIDTFSGELVLHGGLDRERENRYQLVIVAADRGNPGLTATSLLVVAVQDVNDNTPEWLESEYSLTIHENTSIDTPIIIVTAEDIDQVDSIDLENGETVYFGTNGLVMYSITSGDPDDQFSIEPLTGVVKIAAPLDRESIDAYELTLTATDGGGRSANARLYVTLLDINDVAPTFTQDEYVVALPENSENGTFVVDVLANDPDLSDGMFFYYDIESGNIDQVFALNSSTGYTWVELPQLDREYIPVYNLTVVAVDFGEPSLTGTSQVIIHLLDENEFPPTFDQESYNGSVPENASILTSILSVTTSDPDLMENSTSLFTILSISTPYPDLMESSTSLFAVEEIFNETIFETLFQIDHHSGVLYLSGLLDFENITEYNLVVMAMDSGPSERRLSSQVNITVSITDINDNLPIFFNSSYSVSIREDTPPLTPLIILEASDADSGVNSEFYFSLDPLGDNEFFTLDPLTGQLSFANNADLDYEFQSSYTFTAIATDSGSPQLSSTVSVTVLIEDVNDNAPVFATPSFSSSVPENSVEYLVSVITASDADSGRNAELSFDIVGEIFSVNECLVACSSSEIVCDSLTLPPSSSSTTNSSLPLSFTINNETGEVTTSLPLDREHRPIHLLVISATDSGLETQLTSHTCLLVTVLDENDETPTFPEAGYTANVSEATVAGVEVVHVMALDEDQGTNAVVVYAVVSESSSFTIHPMTGQLVTLGGYDRESTNVYDVVVMATDEGSPPLNSTTVVRVTITDENDNAPVFDQSDYFVEFSENQPPLSPVILVEASDRDIGTNAELTYSISSSTPRDHFTINSTSGLLLSTIPLDREGITSYLVTIISTDAGNPPLSSTTEVTIEVIDTNDNAPVFTQTNYDVFINENTLPDDPIITLSSSDRDNGTNSIVHYYIIETDPQSDVFSIDSVSGEISLFSPLDAEISLSYTVTVAGVNDETTPQLSTLTIVTVTVGDLNDHTPFFIRPDYVVVVLESVDVGSEVIDLDARDNDATDSNSDHYFEISGGHDTNLFSIDLKTGLISTTALLDRENEHQHILQVRVFDNGTEPGQLESVVNVTIVLQDTNDNYPVFDQSSYFFSIHENEVVGLLIGQVQASDSDLQYITYSLSSESTTGSSELVQGSGSTIGSESGAGSELGSGSGSGSGYGTESGTGTGSGLVSRSGFGAESGTDSEFGSGMVVSGSGPVEREFFTINPTTGEIFTAISFDREQRDTYTFIVIATDSTTLPMNNGTVSSDNGTVPSYNETVFQLSSEVVVTVEILDRNDVSPSFSLPTYSIAWPEDTPTGTTLLTVSTFDPDLEKSGVVEYLLHPNNDSTFFFVNSTRGDIILTQDLDRETQDLFQFDVIARDFGVPRLSSSVAVVMSVTDVNDNLPLLNASQYSGVFSEHTSLGTILISVSASDDDIDVNSEITFSLSYDFNSTFTISEKTGLISLSSPLDYESVTSYTFFVVATDNGEPRLSTSSEVMILITDLNDNPPVFDSATYTIEISEDAILGTSIFRIPATDADSTSNGELHYSILSGDTESNFRLDERSGLISLQDHLDREVSDGYSLLVRAVDQGQPKRTAQALLLVIVGDINDHSPEFDSDVYHVSIPEQSGIGTPVITMRATDTDTGSNANLTYSIIEGDPEEKFEIDFLTGEVIVSGDLDFENVPSYGLTVMVSDQGQPLSHSSTVILSVSVLDDNEHPPSYLLPEYTIHVPENTPPGARVGSFPANDRDTHQLSSLSYSLTDHNHSNASYFSIDSYTGDLYSLSLLPSNEDLSVSIIVNDGQYTTTIDVTIRVFPLSSSLPIFMPLTFTFSVYEDAFIGEMIGLLTLSTGEELDVIFSLVHGSFLDLPFEVSSNGAINVIGQLDYETTPTWLFQVQATSTSNSSLISQAVVTIEIDDTNDNPPQFESNSYSLVLSELTPVSTLLLTLSSYDLDSSGDNSDVEYTIAAGNVRGKFNLDPATGELTLVDILDYEEEQSIQLNVTVTNHRAELPHPPLSSQAIVWVELVDENDHTPQFGDPYYQATVSSSAVEGTPVLTLTAQDSDSGSNSDISFFLTHLDIPLSFAIDSYTGVVTTGPGFKGDIELYVVSAAVSDGGSPQPRTETTAIYISVIRDNNYPPEFTTPDNGYTVTIPETLPVGGSVIELSATDPDSPESLITYSIFSGNPGGNFIIDPSTGVLTIAESIDYNVQSMFLLVVMAEDSGNPPRNSSVLLTVIIEDVNNHAPQFPTNHYFLNVLENVTVDTILSNITATDPDTTSITYILSLNSFHGETPLFYLDNETGILIVAGELDREIRDVHNLLVSAVDSGYPLKLSHSVPITITIIDLNDTPPEFDQSEYVFPLLRYLAAGVDIAVVTATDSDLIGEELEYSIAEDSSGGVVGVNSSSGVLYARERVPESSVGSYELTVAVLDGQFTTTVPVTLLLISDGFFCEDSGVCTDVDPVNCSFIEFGTCDPVSLGAIYDPFCTHSDYVVTPEQYLCVRHYCEDPGLSLCLPSPLSCLPHNVPCNGQCPQGTSLCPTTLLCHVTSLTESCDNTNITCLVDQILIENSESLRECSLLTSLPLTAQDCYSHNQLYCTATDDCANITTSSPACPYCAPPLTLCRDTKQCVYSPDHCCGEDASFCEILNVCLSVNEVCLPPNIPPSLSTSFIHLGSISDPNSLSSDLYSASGDPVPLSGDGHVIALLLSNKTNVPAVDSQGEEVSIAIVEASEDEGGEGEWQYGLCANTNYSLLNENCTEWVWSSVGVVSNNNALVLPSTARLRFLRLGVVQEGVVWIRVKLWDGNRDGYLSPFTDLVRHSLPHHLPTLPFTDTSPFSENSTFITVLLLPLLPHPSFPPSAPLTLSPIHEDTLVPGNPGTTVRDIVSQIVLPDLPVLDEHTLPGLPPTLTFEDFEYLEPLAVMEYQEVVTMVNPIRHARKSVMERGLGPGIGIRHSPESSEEVKGQWQVTWNGDVRQYEYLSSVLESTNQILLLNTSSRIRFVPRPDYCGTVSIPFHPWDGVWNEDQTNITETGFILTSETALSAVNLNEVVSVTMTIECIPDKPILLMDQFQLEPIPYYISHAYERLFTTIVSVETEGLRGNQERLSELLHLVLEREVSIVRIAGHYSTLSSQVSFTIEEDDLTFSEVETLLLEKSNVLHDLGFPISDISSIAYYGPGERCSSSLTPQPVSGVTVSSITNQIANDRDGETLGLAVTSSVNNNRGMWQYLRGNWSLLYQISFTNLSDIISSTSHRGPWTNFPPNLRESKALLLHPNDRIRFLPKPNYFWSSLPPSLSVKAWDLSMGETLLSTANEAFLAGINTDPLLDTTQSLFHTIGQFSDDSAILVATRRGCNDVIDSGMTFDPCCVCGGNGGSCAGCDGVVGSGRSLDGCGQCGGDRGGCEGCDMIPFSLSEAGGCGECVSVGGVRGDLVEVVRRGMGEAVVDCEGVCYGEGVKDDCGDCVAGDSDQLYNNDMDCTGVCGGLATLDDCGHCTGPGTGLLHNWNRDCSRVCGGIFLSDSCGVCQLPTEFIKHRDCAGECFGPAVLDECGVCYDNPLSPLLGSSVDVCGVCGGENTTCSGCDGVPASGVTVDSCGVCGGNDCGCFKIDSIEPRWGPKSGGTEIIVRGAGFFLNVSGIVFDPRVENCGAPREIGGESILATCRFVSGQNNDITADDVIIVNQSTIRCVTKATTTTTNLPFDLTISIATGPQSNPVLFRYYDDDLVAISHISPVDIELGSVSNITFHGDHFDNTGSTVCFLYDPEPCGFEITNEENPLVLSANYISESEVSCSLPTATIPCQIRIELSQDGQRSGVISSSGDLIFTYRYSAPLVELIQFSRDLSDLLIRFDRSIHLSTLATDSDDDDDDDDDDENSDSLFDCNEVFRTETLSLLGPDPTCYWQNNLQDVLVVHLPPTATITAHSTLSFQANTLTTRGQIYSYSISESDSFNIDSDFNYLTPVAIVDGPHSIPPCGQVTFSGLHSSNPGYGGMTYSWTVLIEDSRLAGYNEILTILDSLGGDEDSISLNSEWFVEDVDYFLQLVVVNSVGIASSPSVIHLMKESDGRPDVFILGSDEREIREGEGVVLEAEIFLPTCFLSNPPRLSYLWEVNQIIDERRGVISLIDISSLPSSSPILYLPPSLLSPSSLYNISLSVTFHVTTPLTEVANISLSVTPTQLQAIIHGGNRTISGNGTLVLDARESIYSRDPMTTPTFSWRCNEVPSGRPCYNRSISTPTTPIVIPESELVIIPGSDLEPGLTYNFTVELSGGTSRDYSSVIITVIEGSTPLVEVVPAVGEYVTSHQLVVRGVVFSSTPLFSLTWESVKIEGQGTVDLSAVSLTPTSLTDTIQPSLSLGYPTSVNLVLPPHSLTPHLPHTLRLSATNKAGTSSSSVTITPRPSPHSASLSFAPPSGLAFNTIFTMRVSGALGAMENTPFLYQFGITTGNEEGVVWLSEAQVEPHLQTLLPSGMEPGHVILAVARVYDRDGGFFDVNGGVTVDPNPSTSDISLMNLLTELKDNYTNNRDWEHLLSHLVSIAMEISSTPSLSSLKQEALSLFLNVFTNDLPATLTHYQLASQILSLLVTNTDSTSLTINTATALNAITEFFKTLSSPLLATTLPVPLGISVEPLQLLPVEAAESTSSHLPISTATNLLKSWSTLLSSPSTSTNLLITSGEAIQNVGITLCQGMVYGEAPSLVTSSLISLEAYKTPPPTGQVNISTHLVEFGELSSNSAYLRQVCTQPQQICLETCLLATSVSPDSFYNDDFELAPSAEELIIVNIEGSDPKGVVLVSSVLSLSVPIPSQDGFLQVTGSEVEIVVLFQVGDRNETSDGNIPLCLYRNYGGSHGFSDTLWYLDSTLPPPITIVDSEYYYRCGYSHLTEFAIGLLPPPYIPPPPSSSPTPSPSPSSSPTPSPTPSPSLPPATAEQTGLSPAVVVIPIFLVIIIATATVLFIVLILYWKRKKSRVLKISPGGARDEEDAGPSSKRPREGPLTPEESKVPMPIIELQEGGKREVLGSMSVLPSIRLRELRYHIADQFDGFNNKPFYFLTRQLVDIDPPTEQQQFVSLVYGDEANKPVFVRRIETTNELTRLHFCVCGNAAQFECSSCSVRGYCSPECQTKDWADKHQRECGRLGEKKQRMSILKRQTSSTSLLGEQDHLPPIFPERQRVSAATPLDFRSLLQSQHSFQQRSSVASPPSLEPSMATPSLSTPVKPPLPPLTTPRRPGLPPLTSPTASRPTLPPLSTPRNRTTLSMLAGRTQPPTIQEESEEEEEEPAYATIQTPASSNFRHVVPRKLAPLTTSPPRTSVTSPLSPFTPAHIHRTLSPPSHSTPITTSPHHFNSSQLFHRLDRSKQTTASSSLQPPHQQTDARKISIRSLGGPEEYSLTSPLGQGGGGRRGERKQAKLPESSSSESESDSEEEEEENVGSTRTPATKEASSNSSTGSEESGEESSDTTQPSTPLVQ